MHGVDSKLQGPIIHPGPHAMYMQGDAVCAVSFAMLPAYSFAEVVAGTSARLRRNILRALSDCSE